MAELNLSQITDRLNEAFAGEGRKLVFWYDDNAEFAEDVDAIELKNAKLYKLTPTNQFRTKLLLERQNTATNYLLYAPFAKPPVEKNHLEDTLLYSKRFYADRASLLCTNLGVPDKCRPAIQKYIKFFGAKQREQRFVDLGIDNFTAENIEIGIMSVLCQSKIASFDEVVRVLLTDSGLEDNKYLAEFAKYGLTAAFWKQCENIFGYADDNPTLEKLVVTMFVTYTAKDVKAELPQTWRSFVSFKPGNIMVLLDSLMNNLLYRDCYDALSAHVEQGLSAAKAFAALPPDSFVECDTFLCIDRLLVAWLTDRLQNEDTGVLLDGHTIPEVCQMRQKMHFAAKTGTSYAVLESAWHIISAASYRPETGLKEIQTKYIMQDYKIDAWYRKFITSLDRLQNSAAFGELQQRVENIYTNEYLSKLLPAWNAALTPYAVTLGIPQQREFYNARVRNIKERVVVIISDAMRFEVGKALAEKLEQDPNSTVTMGAQLSVLPSYTALGMAALLPHRVLEMTDDYKVLIDGKPTDSLPARQAILQSYQPQSCCIQFDTLKHMKTKADLRTVFTGKQVVYVYHNQIDARGETLRTEDEVFQACDEAVDEIVAMVHNIATNGNTYRFLVTADHGFIYKRDSLNESDKISGKAGKGAFLDRRFIISQETITDDGVAFASLGDVLDNHDEKMVSFPIGASVFKTGGGMNYVHGGSSPQEMIVPVLDIKMERYHMDTHSVQIALVSIVRRVTNLHTALDFIQTEPVSDTVKAASFRIYFVTEDNERISNENILTAESRSEEPAKRMVRLNFTLKDIKYSSVQRYYLVACDEKNGQEVLRQEVTIDIAFENDTGFGF